MKRIYIKNASGFYLTKWTGCFSSWVGDAAEHYEMQFPDICNELGRNDLTIEYV